MRAGGIAQGSVLPVMYSAGTSPHHSKKKQTQTKQKTNNQKNQDRKEGQILKF